MLLWYPFNWFVPPFGGGPQHMLLYNRNLKSY